MARTRKPSRANITVELEGNGAKMAPARGQAKTLSQAKARVRLLTIPGIKKNLLAEAQSV
jgi:hypothetical protein